MNDFAQAALAVGVSGLLLSVPPLVVMSLVSLEEIPGYLHNRARILRAASPYLAALSAAVLLLGAALAFFSCATDGIGMFATDGVFLSAAAESSPATPVVDTLQYVSR